MSRRARVVVGVVGWTAVAIVAISLVRARAPREEALEVLTPIAEFSLTDQDGHEFGTAQLRGRVWIAGFAFTSCTSVCPMLTSQMANVQRRIASHGDDVHLVTVTVDPETDTPERLREYGERHGADFAHWSFLGGAPEQVRVTLTRGFLVPIGERVPEADQGAGYDILHTSQLMLVDRQSRLRGLYPTDAESLDRLVRDVDRLLAE